MAVSLNMKLNDCPSQIFDRTADDEIAPVKSPEAKLMGQTFCIFQVQKVPTLGTPVPAIARLKAILCRIPLRY